MRKQKKKKKAGKSRKHRPAKSAPSKKAAGKSSAARKQRAKKRVVRKSRARQASRGARGRAEVVDSVVFEPAGLGSRSSGQSGDLQGLTDRGEADSESVDELLEEGNAFEAGIVKGVEDAGEMPRRGIRTREVPADDIPEEYLEKDE